MKFRTSEGDTVDVHPDFTRQAISKGWTVAEDPSPNAGRADRLVTLSRREGQMISKLYKLPAGDAKRSAIEADLERVRGEIGSLTSNEDAPLIAMDATGRIRTHDLGKAAINAIPTAAGIAGGILGGAGGSILGLGVGGVPGAIGGAALFGSGGEAVRQLASRAAGLPAPDTPAEAAKGIGIEGARQGAMEAGGQAVGGVLKKAGKLLVGGALRPSQSLVREFGDVTGTAMQNRIPVGNGVPAVDAAADFLKMWKSGKGTDIASEMLNGSSQNLNALLADAEARGVTFNAQDPEIVNALSALVQDVKKQPLSDADEAAIRKLWVQFVNEHRAPTPNGGPGPLVPITPRAFNEMKRKAQEIARPIYAAQERGNPVTVSASRRGQFNRSVATGARKAIEREVPEASAANSEIARLIALNQAMKTAEARNPQYLNGLNPTSWPGMNVMASPEFASRLGLLLDYIGGVPTRGAAHFVPMGPTTDR